MRYARVRGPPLFFGSLLMSGIIFVKKNIILDLFLFRPGVLWFFACPGSKGSKSQLEKRVFPA